MFSFIKAFISGFLSTLIFHQGLFGVFFLMGLKPHPPYNLSLVPPFAIPSVVSLAFFGGLWGIIIWKLVSKSIGFKSLFFYFVYGAVGPTLLTYILIFPLKGVPFNLEMIPYSLLLNGFWGVGVCFFMSLLSSNKR